MLNWLSKANEWLYSKETKVVDATIITALKGLASLLVRFDSLFIIVALVGLFLVMAGDEKHGFRLSSLSILIYVLLKVVTGC